MKLQKTSKEPLLHIAKRNKMPWWKGLLIRVGAVGAALVVCFLFAMIIVDVNPAEMTKAFWEGNFRSVNKIFILLKDVSILLLIALALTPAFKMRFWNIGGEGQVLVGAVAAIACAYYLGGKLPEPLLLVVMLLAAVAAGAFWAVLPAICKALWNSNETLFTLMMNYIATQGVWLMLAIWEPRDNSQEPLPYGILNFFPKIKLFGKTGMGDELTVILIAILITVAMYIYLKYSKQGYEVAVVGESENTARYIGINIKKVIVRTMVLSGALCGLVGFLIGAVFNHSITATMAGGQGFTAIMVSWLGKFNPFVMAGISFIISFLENGASNLVDVLSSRGIGSGAQTGISPDFPNVIVGIILFFIVGCEFFIHYKVKLKAKTPKGGKEQ